MEKQDFQFEEGCKAFDSGLAEDDCPYPIIKGGGDENGYRYWWLMGFYHARIRSKLPEYFE
jgi:hypothetical protein